MFDAHVMVFLLAAGVAASQAPAGEGDSEATGAVARAAAPSRVMLRSSDRRFLVVGGDRTSVLDLAAWAESMGRKIERAVGIEQARVPWRDFRIELMPSNAAARVEAALVRTESGFLQRLVIPDVESVPRPDIAEGFCRLFFTGYALDRRAEFRRGRGESPPAEPRMAPPWMGRGLLASQEPAQRAENAEAVYRRWREGKLPPLAAFLRDEPASAPWVDAAASRAVDGLLFAWLKGRTDRTESFGRMFEALAKGDPLAAPGLAACLPECATTSALEAGWDEWILRQRKIVHEPGRANVFAVEGLQAELLLRPGEFGIGSAPQIPAPTGFAALIGRRGEPWIRGFAGDREARLWLAATGRGPAAEEIARRYGQFLRALARGASERDLRERLAAAEAAMAALERVVAANER
jgi:hypothetical protein